MEEPVDKLPALKPLEDLTDADIMQLTREDCRRYLKERGMRRPSWNKAEAIQQVLLLKGLFGSCKSQDKGQSNNDSVVPRPACEEQQSKEFLDKSKPAVPAYSPPVVPQFRSLSSSDLRQEAPQAAKPPHTAQLTIFYSGVVNVFDDVPLDKAQAVMLLAASKSPNGPEYLQAHPTNQCRRVPPFATPEGITTQPQEDSTESCLPQARTASLQRFLAKRRERISANPYKRSDKSKKRRASPAVSCSNKQQHKRLKGNSRSKSSGSSDNSCSDPGAVRFDLATTLPAMCYGKNAGGAPSAPALFPSGQPRIVSAM